MQNRAQQIKYTNVYIVDIGILKYMKRPITELDPRGWKLARTSIVFTPLVIVYRYLFFESPFRL